jgi:hypothetical protein
LDLISNYVWVRLGDSVAIGSSRTNHRKGIFVGRVDELGSPELQFLEAAIRPSAALNEYEYDDDDDDESETSRDMESERHSGCSSSGVGVGLACGGDALIGALQRLLAAMERVSEGYFWLKDGRLITEIEHTSSRSRDR